MATTKTKSKNASRKAARGSSTERVAPAELHPRRPGWLNGSELADAAQATQPLMADLSSCTTDQLKSLTRKRLAEEIDFISNAEFDESGAWKWVFESELGLQPRTAELGLAAIRRGGSDMPAHLCRLCETPLLKPEQEKMLFQRMNFLRQLAAAHREKLNPKRPSRVRLQLIEELLLLAEWHRDCIVEANLRLVFSIVKKFANPNVTFEELLSDGIVAIIRAVEKFDFDRGFRFSTYATQVIRRSSYQTVVVKQQERQTTLGGLQDMDLEITDEGRESAISKSRWHELRAKLAGMMDQLDRREKFIIRARFSLGAHRKVYTLQAIANRLGVSKERVRQLERRAMEKLQAMAADDHGAEEFPLEGAAQSSS